jgi:hypothetical protein
VTTPRHATQLRFVRGHESTELHIERLPHGAISRRGLSKAVPRSSLRDAARTDAARTMASFVRMDAHCEPGLDCEPGLGGPSEATSGETARSSPVALCAAVADEPSDGRVLGHHRARPAGATKGIAARPNVAAKILPR